MLFTHHYIINHVIITPVFIHLASSHICNNGEQGLGVYFYPRECFTEIGWFTNAVQCLEVMVDTEAGTEDRTFASRTVRNESFTVKTVLNCEL